MLQIYLEMYQFMLNNSLGIYTFYFRNLYSGQHSSLKVLSFQFLEIVTSNF